MGRRKGFLDRMAQLQREAEKRRIAEQKAQTKLARDLERARKAYERATLADQKERQRLYMEARTAEVALKNEELETLIDQLNALLADTLSVDDYFDLDTLKEQPDVPPFQPGALGNAEAAPIIGLYLPAPLSGMRKLVPGAKAKYEQEVAAANEHYQHDLDAHAAREAERLRQLAQKRAEYERQVAEIMQRNAAQHEEIERLKQDYAVGRPDAVAYYCSLVLQSSVYPDGFQQHARIAYVPESKQLVVEYGLPPFEIIPDIGAYKYNKTKDEVTTTARPTTQRKALYSSVIA